MKEIEQVFESLRPATQLAFTFLTWLFGNLNTITAVLAFVVLLFQLKVVYYNGKLKKIKYGKECSGGGE